MFIKMRKIKYNYAKLKCSKNSAFCSVQFNARNLDCTDIKKIQSWSIVDTYWLFWRKDFGPLIWLAAIFRFYDVASASETALCGYFWFMTLLMLEQEFDLLTSRDGHWGGVYWGGVYFYDPRADRRWIGQRAWHRHQILMTYLRVTT